jgi:hypothetical protein
MGRSLMNCVAIHCRPTGNAKHFLGVGGWHFCEMPGRVLFRGSLADRCASVLADRCAGMLADRCADKPAHRWAGASVHRSAGRTAQSRLYWARLYWPDCIQSVCIGPVCIWPVSIATDGLSEPHRRVDVASKKTQSDKIYPPARTRLKGKRRLGLAGECLFRLDWFRI